MVGKTLFGPVRGGKDVPSATTTTGMSPSTLTPHHYHSPVPSGAKTGPGTEQPVRRGRPASTVDRRREDVAAPRSLINVRTQAKRRTEIVLSLFGSGIVVGHSTITSLGQNSKIPADIVRSSATSSASRRSRTWRTAGWPPTPTPWCCRWPRCSTASATWSSRDGTTCTPTSVRHEPGAVDRHRRRRLCPHPAGRAPHRDLERYRYLLLLLAGILRLPLGVPPINGARLWVISSKSASSRRAVQDPSLHLLRVGFRKNKELLTIPTAQISIRLFLDPRPLLPIWWPGGRRWGSSE